MMTSLPSVIKAQRPGFSASPRRSVLVEAVSGDFDEEPAPPTPEEIAIRLVADAHSHSARIVSDAQAESTRIRELAKQEGFEAGEAQAKNAWQVRMSQLEVRAEEMEREHEQFFVSAEPELARLSVEIARKILKQEIAQSPEAVLKIVRSAIHRVKEKEVRILVNPADLEAVRHERDSFQGIADGVTGIEIVSDRRVGQGGCVLETPGGSIDARIETQLTHISEVIDKEAGDAPNATNAES
jgi:flagellar assembly protein FliH